MQTAGGVLISDERTLATLYRAVLALTQRRHRDGLVCATRARRRDRLTLVPPPKLQLRDGVSWIPLV